MAMWPDLFGPGWVWAALLSVGILSATVGIVLWWFAATREAPEEADPLQAIWHRYEEGDLTRAEFQRLRRLYAPITEAVPHGRGLGAPEHQEGWVHQGG